MRHFALLAVCFSCLTGVAVHGEEGLFSEVAMEAVQNDPKVIEVYLGH